MLNSIADLVRFLTHFHRGRCVDPSIPNVALPEGLPDSLGALYRGLGRLIDHKPGDAPFGRPPFAAQDSLVPLDRLVIVDGTFEFAWENQGNWSARCARGAEASTVYTNAADLWRSDQRGHVAIATSLDHFLTTLCLQEAVLSCMNLVPISDEVVPSATITMPVTPLCLHCEYVEAEPTHHFWQASGGDVLIMKASDTIWVGSPTLDVERLLLAPARAHRVD